MSSSDHIFYHPSKELQNTLDSIHELSARYREILGPIPRFSPYNSELSKVITEFRDSISNTMGPLQVPLESLSGIQELCRPLINFPPLKLEPLINEFSKSLGGLPSFSNAYLSNPENLEFRESITKIINGYLSFESDMSPSPIDDSEYCNRNDDYVSIDESAISEFQIPENIAIPIGNNRIKINTEFFITIIITIISIFVPLIVSCCQDYQNSRSQDEQFGKLEHSIDDQNQILQMQNSILNGLLDSVDTSLSSQSEAIEELKKYLQVQNSRISDLEEFLDSYQQSIDSTKSPENIPSEDK